MSAIMSLLPPWQTLLAIVGVEVLVLGLFDLLVYVPMFIRLLLRKHQFVHRMVTSDIPGNYHAFDNAVISLFRTLPEPNNFNVVWTRVPLDEDIVVCGTLPPSRMNSLTVYNAERAEDVPNSMELHDKHCELILSKDSTKTQLEIDKKWKFGMVVIRNYLVPPGTTVVTPEIRRVRDGHILRPSQAIPSGAPVLHLDFSSQIRKGLYFVAGNVVCGFLNAYLYFACGLTSDKFKTVVTLSMSDFIVCNVLVSLVGLLLAVGLYKGVFLVGKKRMSTFCHDFCQHQVNTLKLCPLDKGAEGSQPSKLHTYYLMCYDVPEGFDLQVTGKIDARRQQYWSLVVYDEYGLPLPSFVYDQNVTRLNVDGDQYEYDIRMRHQAGGRRVRSNSTHTVVDVTKCSKGYVLFRLVHPKDDEVQQYSLPMTTLVKIADTQEEKKKQ